MIFTGASFSKFIKMLKKREYNVAIGNNNVYNRFSIFLEADLGIKKKTNKKQIPNAKIKILFGFEDTDLQN